MSISSMVSSIFGGAATAQPAAPQPTQQQAQPNPGQIPPNTGIPAQQLPNTAANGLVPEQQKEVAPLDEFADLWKNEPTDPNKPPVDNSMFGKVDGDQLMQAASQIDFTKVVTPEMLQDIQAGGEAGTKALLQALNKTQQLGYAQSTHATTILIEKAMLKAKEQFTADLPNHIRNSSLNAAIKETPAYQHPAAQPLIQGLTTQLQVKYPNATPGELADMANRYITNFAAQMQPKKQEQAAAPGEDWDVFLNAR